MGTIRLNAGLLAGKDLRLLDASAVTEFARSSESNNLTGVSFYDGELRRETFRGVNFSDCSFARTKFDSVTFRKCSFNRVDFTRTHFVNCHFSECRFTDCDPYYAYFIRTVVDPAAFKLCYRENDWNKALILFSNLKLGLEKAGNGRLARAAEYYYRVWERRRLYNLWRVRETSGMTPWLSSLFIGSLTGYGERPIYVGFWMLGLITVMSFVYQRWFPFSVSAGTTRLGDYWYFSFKVFCAQGFATEFLTAGLLVCQVAEFALGLVLIALLVASITRKLS